MEPLQSLPIPTSEEVEGTSNRPAKRMRYEGPVVEKWEDAEVYGIQLDTKLFIFPDYNAYQQNAVERQVRSAKHENELGKESRLAKVENAKRFACPSETRSSTRVFILWEREDGKLCLGRAYRSFFGKCWRHFTMNQMCYDGFQDAWTMSILFAPDEEPPKSSDDDDDDEIYPSHNVAIDDYTPLEISEPVEPPFPLVPPSTGKEDVLYSAQASNEDMEFMYPGGLSLKRWKNPDDFETIMTSRYFFGYNPYRTAPIPRDVNIHDELQVFSKNLGQFPLSASSSSMQGSQYFSQMAYYLHLLDKIYQRNQNRDYRAFQKIFHVANSRIQIKLFCISKSGEKLYSVIPFKNTSDVAYTLVVPNVMTAFEIVERDWSHLI